MTTPSASLAPNLDGLMKVIYAYRTVFCLLRPQGCKLQGAHVPALRNSRLEKELGWSDGNGECDLRECGRTCLCKYVSVVVGWCERKRDGEKKQCAIYWK